MMPTSRRMDRAQIGAGIDDARNIARLLPWIVGPRALHPVEPTVVTAHDLPPCRLRS
jgi:hypothetical protein